MERFGGRARGIISRVTRQEWNPPDPDSQLPPYPGSQGIPQRLISASSYSYEERRVAAAGPYMQDDRRNDRSTSRSHGRRGMRSRHARAVYSEDYAPGVNPRNVYGYSDHAREQMRTAHSLRDAAFEASYYAGMDDEI